VANGEALFGPAVARRLMEYITSGSTANASASSFSDLGDREREILALLAQGNSNQKIADKLKLSLKTVRNYVSNILAKLHAVDREDAIARARKAGLVE
jgi:DNA-binding NarL/FixJ family response regulator